MIHKIPEIRAAMDDYDILAITETWLNSKVNINFKNYTILRKDDKGQDKRLRNVAKGGLCFLIKSCINYKERKNVSWTKDKTEILAITLQTTKGELDLILVYRTPSKNLSTNQWNNLWNNVRPGTPTLIMGDLNAKSKIWNYRSTDHAGTQLMKSMDNADMHVVNSETMSRSASGLQSPSNIDLVITDFSMMQRTRCADTGLTMGSDHQIDWRKVNLNLENFKSRVTEKIDKNENLDDIVEDLASTLNRAMSVAIGQRPVNDRAPKDSNKQVRRPNNRQTWWDAQCEEMRQKKKRALLKFTSKPNSTYWETYKAIEGEFKKLIKEKKRDSWTKFAESINHQTSKTTIWKKVKSLQQTFTKNNKTGQDTKERNTQEEKEIKKILGEDKLMPSTGNFLPQPLSDSTIRENDETRITLRNVDKALKKSNDKSAPGEDAIDYHIIKKLNADFRDMLAKIYTKVWVQGRIPKAWKRAIIVLLEKPGKSSLRSIALTNCTGKILERIVNERLIKWAESEHIMDEWQNGFRRNRSTIDNLVKLTNDVHVGFATGKYTLAAFLDIESAYDRVDHTTLIEILKKKECPTMIVNYIINWLTDRTAKIIRRFEKPAEGRVTRGLPQGSILSPMLYNIYTSDLGKGLDRSKIKILQYADDIVVYVTNSNMDINRKTLETAIQTIIKNLRVIKLSLATGKTGLVNFSMLNMSRMTNRSVLSGGNVAIRVGDSTIRDGPSIKFLGVILD